MRNDKRYDQHDLRALNAGSSSSLKSNMQRRDVVFTEYTNEQRRLRPNEPHHTVHMSMNYQGALPMRYDKSDPPHKYTITCITHASIVLDHDQSWSIVTHSSAHTDQWSDPRLTLKWPIRMWLSDYRMMPYIDEWSSRVLIEWCHMKSGNRASSHYQT